MTSVHFTRNIAPASYFEIRIDGVLEKNALIKNVDGGMVKAKVVEEITASSPTPIKHTTTRECEPLTVEVAATGSGMLWKWISDSWNKRYARYNGEVVHGDVKEKSVTSQEFFNALIEEVTFPTLDANAKELCYLKVKIRPEYSTFKFDEGAQMSKEVAKTQKAWEASAFRLTIDDVDTEFVDKIESFTVKQKIKQVPCGSFVGAMSLPQLEPVGVVFPNLKVQMPLSTSKGMLAWYEQMRQGVPDSQTKKQGRIEFLDTTRNKVLGWLTLKDVGINAMNVGKSEAKQDAVKRVTFELYVSAMEIGEYKGEFWAPIP